MIFSQGKDNDFDIAIRLVRPKSRARSISSTLGSILQTVGSYIAALEYHKKELAIDAELQDRAEMANDHEITSISC